MRSLSRCWTVSVRNLDNSGVVKGWQKGGKRVCFSQKVYIMFITGRSVSMARNGLRGVGWFWGGFKGSCSVFSELFNHLFQGLLWRAYRWVLDVLAAFDFAVDPILCFFDFPFSEVGKLI